MLALAAGLACSDDALSPESTRETGAPENVLQAYDCQVTVAAQTIECAPRVPVTGPASGNSLIVGGPNGTYVHMSASNTVSTPDSISFDVTLQNRIVQAMGTVDGVTADPAGSRIFFTSVSCTALDPALPAEVRIGNADGEAYISAPGQAYFQYPGVLAHLRTSAPRRWRFDGQNVGTLRFSVMVWTRVQHPQGWAEIAPDRPLLGDGQVDTLEATVLSRLGRPLLDPVVWSSADPGIAVVASLSDSTAQITAVGTGSTWVRAVSARDGTVRDSVLVTAGARVEIAPEILALSPGQTDLLAVAVLDGFGGHLPGDVVWSSAEPLIAAVSAVDDRTAKITATGSGSTWVRAASASNGALRDSVLVLVDFGADM